MGGNGLIAPYRQDRIQAGGERSGDHAGEQTEQNQDRARDEHRRQGDGQVNVALAGGVLENRAEERERPDAPDQNSGQQKTHQTAGERQQQPLEEDLQEDVGAARTEGLEYADLPRPLGY